MARIKTGVSKKSNRENLKALEMIYEWRKYGETGFHLTPEFAWVVSDGKFGTEPKMISAMPVRFAPLGAATIDAVKVARHIIRLNGLVK
jgi:hypothetical protein